MTVEASQLDALVEKLRRLPEWRLRSALVSLREIVEEPYELTGEELAVLRPALDEALRGEHLTDAETDEILTKPWA